MRRYHETFRLWEYLLFAVVTLAVLCLCVCIGSVTTANRRYSQSLNVS